MTTETSTSAHAPLPWSQMLVRLNVAAGFTAAFMAITGAALTRYGQTLAMPPFGFGLLAALPFLTALVQVPASYLVERYGHRRLVSILFTFIHRSLWLAVAAVPWIMPQAWWWMGLLMLVAVSSTFAHFGAPATTSWAADLVPSRLRGRYYALRGQMVRLINVPLCLLIGWVMDRAQHQGLHALTLAISIMLACAALLGMVDSLLCLALPDRWHRPQTDGLRLREIFSRPLQNRSFRYFLGYTGFITLATGYVGPYVWLYLVDEVRLSNTEATFMTMVGTALTSLFGMRFWGRLVDRWGCKRVMLIAGLLVINGASAWGMVTTETKWTGYLVVLLSSFAWPGMELASGNLLYAMSESGRGEARLGSAYTALNSTVLAIAGTISGVFGGWVAEILHGWRTTVFGWPITFHVVLFIISAFLRIIALLWVLGLSDDRARRAKPATRTLSDPA